MKYALVLAVSTAVGCGDSPAGEVDAPAPAIDAAPTADAYDISARPFALYVPTGYVAGTPVPLVVLLHGYGASGAVQENYFQLQPVAEAETFLYATPDGIVDTDGSRFWNATDACCNLYGDGVDDVAYLRALIDDVSARYTVDPKRVFLVGHSNGGFMSHRMACDAADQVAAIVSLAGMTWNDPGQCTPAAPVAVAQVHGTGDTVIAYGGGTVFGQAPYPSAVATVEAWASRNGCTGTDASTTLDLESGLVGAETTITRSTGCATGAAELWTIAGGSHIPSFQPIWAQTVWDFLSAHPRP